MFRKSGVVVFGLVVGSSIAAEAGDAGGRVRRDVPSGESVRTRLNVDAPAEGEKHPIVVWVHGGAWRFGSKDFIQGQPKAFNEEGYVWVGVEYRFVPEVTYKEQAGDVARAVRWARDHAEEFGGDPDRIFLMGHSAGAHLAALVATDGRYLEAAGLKRDAIAGVILLDGAGYDVPRQVRESVLPRIRALYTSVFGDDPEVQRDASPIAHVARDRGVPPFLLLHVGRADSRAQSNALAAKLREAGVPATVLAFPSKTHATINRELGRPGDAPTRAVFDFLKARCEPRPDQNRACMSTLTRSGRSGSIARAGSGCHIAARVAGEGGSP